MHDSTAFPAQRAICLPDASLDRLATNTHSALPPRVEATIAPLGRTLNPGFRLAIWFFWLLASMAVGGMIGAWLSGDAFDISFGIIVGGFTFTSLRLWRKGFD